MSWKYKLYDKEELYLISFVVVYWLAIFIREEYNSLFLETLKFHQKDRLELSAYCIIINHVHLIFRDK